jgi:hypothetical protein
VGVQRSVGWSLGDLDTIEHPRCMVPPVYDESKWPQHKQVAISEFTNKVDAFVNEKSSTLVSAGKSGRSCMLSGLGTIVFARVDGLVAGIKLVPATSGRWSPISLRPRVWAKIKQSHTQIRSMPL